MIHALRKTRGDMGQRGQYRGTRDKQHQLDTMDMTKHGLLLLIVSCRVLLCVNGNEMGNERNNRSKIVVHRVHSRAQSTCPNAKACTATISPHTINLFSPTVPIDVFLSSFSSYLASQCFMVPCDSEIPQQSSMTLQHSQQHHVACSILTLP